MIEIQWPKPEVGKLWIIPGPNCGFAVSCFKKPNWLHRTAMRLVLGWEWVDAPAPDVTSPLKAGSSQGISEQ